jgi:hypothetical protein
MGAEVTPDAGHDPAVFSEALRRALLGAGYTIGRLWVEVGAADVRVGVEILEGGRLVRRPFRIDADAWTMPVDELVGGLVEGLAEGLRS